MKNRSKDSQEGLGSFFVSAMTGLAVAVGSALLLSLILTAVALGMDDPMKPLGAFALGTLFIGAFAGGVTAGIKSGDPAVGLITGVMYVLIVWLASLIIGRGSDPLMSALCYGLCLAAAFSGSFIPTRRRKRRDPRKRRRRAR